jgi:hypothetical protein
MDISDISTSVGTLGGDYSQEIGSKSQDVIAALAGMSVNINTNVAGGTCD